MPTFYGIYRGVVLSTADPAQQDRVQVLVPAISGQTSGWALACQPPGRSTRPKVGDQAWVMFEGGNPSYPVYMGVRPTTD